MALAKLTPLTALAAAAYFFASRIGEKTYKRFARPQILAALRDPVKRAALIGQRKAEIASLPYASMRSRTFAFLIDIPIAIVLLCLGVVLAAIIAVSFGISAGNTSSNYLIFGCCIFMMMLYHSVTVGSGMRGTLGMKVCHICVADLDGTRITSSRAAWREFLKWITLPVYWPLIYLPSKLFWKKAPFIQRRQWLPDIMTKTVVVQRPQNPYYSVASVENPVSSN